MNNYFSSELIKGLDRIGGEEYLLKADMTEICKRLEYLFMKSIGITEKELVIFTMALTVLRDNPDDYSLVKVYFYFPIGLNSLVQLAPLRICLYAEDRPVPTFTFEIPRGVIDKDIPNGELVKFVSENLPNNKSYEQKILIKFLEWSLKRRPEQREVIVKTHY